MISPIRTVIADDEPLARQTLRHLAGLDPELHVLGESRDCIETRELLTRLEPELLYLDIEMPGGNGFAALEGIPSWPAIVFVTAHAEHAVHAFEIEAIDYLLKPFDDRRFAHATERAKVEIRRRRGENRETRIALPGRHGTTLVSQAEIDWIEAADYYASVHVGGAEHLLRESLQSLEERLDRDVFVRIHRSVLVNRTRIRRVQADAVVLQNGVRLRLSRRRREHLRKRLRP